MIGGRRGFERHFLLLLIFFCIPLFVPISAQGALLRAQEPLQDAPNNPTANVTSDERTHLSALAADAPDIKPPKPKACKGDRKFACWANEWLAAQKFATFPVKDCTPCNAKAVKPCEADAKFSMENGNLMTKCKPSLFCEDLKSPATDCIRAVEYKVGTDDVRMVLFPFNLCTPALKQEGGCDNGESTVPPYDPASPHYGIEYYYQCDAGLTVPKDVADSEQGCVPNLLMAAGFGTVPEVPIPGDGLPYENPSFKFCAFNEKPAGETPCEPVPLCELTRPASFDESKIPTNPCFKTCKYSATFDEECVPLEILDGEHVISAYRRASGPFAELLTDEETLQLDFAPTDAIKYPKCVKAEKLSEDQQKLVAANRFLNCDVNPFYDAGNNVAMMLEPVDCKEGEDPKKFLCIPAATTTKEPTSNVPASTSTTTSTTTAMSDGPAPPSTASIGPLPSPGSSTSSPKPSPPNPKPSKNVTKPPTVAPKNSSGNHTSPLPGPKWVAGQGEPCGGGRFGMFFFGFFLGSIFGVMVMIGVVAIWHLFKKKPPRSSPDLTEVHVASSHDLQQPATDKEIAPIIAASGSDLQLQLPRSDGKRGGSAEKVTERQPTERLVTTDRQTDRHVERKRKTERTTERITERQADRQADVPVERAESPVPPRRIHPVSSADVFLPKHRSSPKMQHGSKESAPASNRSPEHSIVDKPKQLVKSLMQAVSKKPSLDKSKELSKDRTRKLPRAKLGNRLDVLEEQERAFDDMPTGKETAKRKKKST